MRHITTTLTLTAALFAIGCGSDDNNFNYGFFPNPTSSPVVTGPTAVADSFSTLGNSVLTGSVTANDTLNGATVTAFQNPSNSGGTVAITSAGQLTYTPPLNAANVNDTFTYTLTNSVGFSTATVTVQIGARGFFVKNDVPATGTGTQTNPFKTLAEAVTASTGINGAQIVLFQGDGTATGLNTATALSNNQSMVAFDSNQPTVSAAITAANNSTLSGLRLTGNVQSTGRNGLAVQNCTVQPAAGNALTIANLSGTLSVRNCAFSGGVTPVNMTQSAGTFQGTVSNCSLTGVSGNGVDLLAQSGATGNLTVDGCQFTNFVLAGINQAIGVRLQTTGAATNVSLQLLNSRVNNADFGFEDTSLAASQALILCVNNTITNTTFQGIAMGAGDPNSLILTRLTNNTLQNNPAGSSMQLSSVSGSRIGIVASGNNAATYQLGNDGTPGVLTQVEVFGVAGASFLSRNAGALSIVGTITDVAAGSLGIP